MKKLLTLFLLLAPALCARAAEVTVCLRDLSGGVMSEFPFRTGAGDSYTTDADGCAVVELAAPGESQIQYDWGFTNFTWDGEQTRVDLNITDGYWMTVQLTGADESEANAVRGATFRVFDDIYDKAYSIGQDMTAHFWLTPAYLQENTWSYQLECPKYPTPRTYVDLAATGNHLTIDLREGRTPVDIARPIGVGGTPLTEGSLSIYQDYDGSGYPFIIEVSLDELPESGAYRSWMVPGTYNFTLPPAGNYMSRLETVSVSTEPMEVNLDLSASALLTVHLVGYDGRPLPNQQININSVDRTASGDRVSRGYGTTDAEGNVSIYAMPGAYRAEVAFYYNPVFPYPSGTGGETFFDVAAGPTAETTISFESYTPFIVTVKGLDDGISPNCEFQYKDADDEYWSSIILSEDDYNFEGEGLRFGTLAQTDGPLSGRLHVAISNWQLPEGSPLYADHYQPVVTTEGGVIEEIDLTAMQDVTLHAPEDYCFYLGLYIDGEEYNFEYPDTGEPVTAIPFRIMPGEHTWQAALASLDGATRYPTGTVQTFTVADAPLDVTYALDAADYPGLRVLVKDVDGTPAAGFSVWLMNVATYEWGDLTTDAEGRGTYFAARPGTFEVTVVEGNYMPQTFTVELDKGMTERTVSFEGWHAFTLRMPDLWPYSQESSTATLTWTSASDPSDPRNGTAMHNEWGNREQPEAWTQWLPAGNLSVRYTARDNNGTIVDATSQTAMPDANTTYAVDLSGHHHVNYVAGDGSAARTNCVTLYRLESDGGRTAIAAAQLLPDGTYMAYYCPWYEDSDSYFPENSDSVSFTVAGADIEVRFNVSESDYRRIGLTHYDERILAAELSNPSDPRWASVYIDEYAQFYLLPRRAYPYYVHYLIVYADNGDALWYYTLPEPRSFSVEPGQEYVEIPLSDYRLIDLTATLDGTPVDGISLVEGAGGLTAINYIYADSPARFALRPGSYTLIVETEPDGTLLYGRITVTEATADGPMTVELSTEPTGMRDAARGDMLGAQPTADGIIVSGAAGTPIAATLYTADGRLALRATTADGATIGNGSLPAGVYIVRLVQGNTAKTQRVLVH